MNRLLTSRPTSTAHASSVASKQDQLLTLMRKKNMLSNNVNSTEELLLRLKLIELDVPKTEKTLSSD